MFLAAQKPRKCDANPAKATQKKSRTAQSLREASVADTKNQRANVGHPMADADPSGVTQSQREAEVLTQFTERQLLGSRRLQKYCRVELVRYCNQNSA